MESHVLFFKIVGAYQWMCNLVVPKVPEDINYKDLLALLTLVLLLLSLYLHAGIISIMLPANLTNPWLDLWQEYAGFLKI